jgi:hypothetical protein
MMLCTMRPASGAIVVLALASGGCATALSSFEPAHVPAAGHVQAEVGVDVSVSTGGIYKIVDAARTLDDTAAQGGMLSDQDKRTILEGGAQLGLNPPALIPHLGVAYVPVERWEIGVRLAASGWRFGVRTQLLQQDQAGIDLTVGFGVGRAAFDPPVHSVLETVEVADFSRWNLDLPVALGRHDSWYRWWGGPRVVYSRMSQSMTLTIPGEPTVTGTVSGSGIYLGGAAGVAFGYRSLFVGPELTVVWLIGRADVTALDVTDSVRLDTLVVYPGFALMGEF